jgi:hypothetical protein
MVKVIYTIFIGILLATSIGVGIAAFYPGPKAPDYPNESVPYKTVPATENPTTQEIRPSESQLAFEKKIKEHQKASEVYNRNVALAAVGFSIAILIISLTFLHSIQMIADGLLLGGVFTLVYGIIRSFGSGEQKFMFAITTLGFVIALVLGYIKFIKPTLKLAAKSK